MATKAKTKAKKMVKGKAVKSPVKKLKKPVKVAPKKKNVKTVKATKATKKTVKKAPVKKKMLSKKVTKPVKLKPSKKKVMSKSVVKKIVKKPIKVAKVKSVSKKAAPVKVVAPVPKVTKSKKIIAHTVVKKIAPAIKKPVKPFAQPKQDWLTMDLSVEIPPYQEKMGEEYMNDKQRDHFHRILLHRRQQLLQEMGRTVHQMHDETATNLPDPNDRATQEEEFSLELRTRDRERKFIKNIEDALQKLDEGEYGYCNACGVEIGIRRLEARPTADLCIDCKTLDEIREKQLGGGI